MGELRSSSPLSGMETEDKTVPRGLKSAIKSLTLAGHQWPKPVILTTGEAKIRRITVQSQLRQIGHETLSQKYPTQSKAGKVAQVIVCLSSMCEALSSNLSTMKKENLRRN
jgi:NAD(P)H-dependent FMN reductase